MVASYFEFLKHPTELVQSLFGASPPAADPLVASTVNPATASTGGAQSTTSFAPQITSPQGLCGWIPSDVGSPTWVCQAFGQVMPGVVFWVSFAVFAVTVIFILRYWFRSLRASHEILSVLKQLDKLQNPGARQWPDIKQCHSILAVLKRSGQKLPPLIELSHKLEGEMVTVDAAKTQVALLKPLSTDMSQGLLKRWTGERLAEQLPSWLTAIGLMTTFLAILLGLHNVKVIGSLEVQGISGLINGLSGKFVSSIVALGCAITVTIVNYWLADRVGLVWARLMYRLESLMPAISVERAFLDLLREREQRAQL